MNKYLVNKKKTFFIFLFYIVINQLLIIKFILCMSIDFN